MQKIKEDITRIVGKQILNLLTNISDENLIGITYLAEKIANDESKRYIKGLRESIQNKTPSYQLMKRFLKECNPNVRKKFVGNFLINAGIIGISRSIEIQKREGWRPPFFIVISPTARCNLKCEGCYAGNYIKADDLPIEVIDHILNEAKELGIYFITISGGEPFLREDMLKIYEKHNDMAFQVYTNGILIDKKLAKRLAELGNVIPGISVEGFEEETNNRRGSGVYSKVQEAMENLREVGVPFGFSTTPTSINSNVLSSEEFIDFYTNKGCYFGWYFQYIPIGLKPDIKLMSTPQQRNKLYHQVQKFRKTKSIFIGDFWNDGPHVGGCIAGARQYAHIICTGDVEPCVFVHFAVDNIKNKSLREVLNSEFFKAFRAKQPYRKNCNLLTPCSIIDNPKILRKLVDKYKAYPTHPGSDSIVKDERIKKHLDNYSMEFGKLADKIWEKDYVNNPTSKWYKEKESYKRLKEKFKNL